MPVLHLNLHAAHDILTSLRMAELNIENEIYSLRRSISRLSSSWYGGTSGMFLDEANSKMRQLERLRDELSTLRYRLSQEFDNWDEMDRNGMSRISL